jgi:hypothetical protein
MVPLPVPLDAPVTEIQPALAAALHVQSWWFGVTVNELLAPDAG